MCLRVSFLCQGNWTLALTQLFLHLGYPVPFVRSDPTSYYFAISHHSCPIIYKPDVDIANIQHQLPQLLLDGICCLAARFVENRDLIASFPHLAGVGQERLRLAREERKSRFDNIDIVLDAMTVQRRRSW